MSCLHSYSLLLLDQKGSVGNGALLSSKFWELYEHMRQVGLDSQPSIKVVKFSRGYPSEEKGGTMRMLGCVCMLRCCFSNKRRRANV